MHTIEYTDRFFIKAFWLFGPKVKRIESKKLECPDSWEQLTKWHLRLLGKVYSFSKMNMDDEFWLLRRWAKMPEKVLIELSAVEVFDLIKFIYSNCEVFESKYRWSSFFYGPQRFLKNFTMDQFGLSQLVFSKFIETGDVKLLNTLCGICYTPFAIPFRSHMVKVCALWFRFFVPHFKKTAMCINYVALRNEVMRQHPHIFPKLKDAQEKDDWTWKEKVVYDWEHTTMMLSGERFGTLEVVRKSRLIPILKYCEMMAVENSKKKKK